jgi:uncharacterized membrane protein
LGNFTIILLLTLEVAVTISHPNQLPLIGMKHLHYVLAVHSTLTFMHMIMRFAPVHQEIHALYWV